MEKLTYIRDEEKLYEAITIKHGRGLIWRRKTIPKNAEPPPPGPPRNKGQNP